MDYTELLRQLREAGYQRVERDDRLQDVFPVEKREKGVELWEWSDGNDVRLLRVRLPYEAAKLKLYVIAHAQLTRLLTENMTANLADFDCIATGSKAYKQL